MDSQKWRREAACQDTEINFFSIDQQEKYKARALCASACPVRLQCLSFALNEKLIWGVWGGVDEYELRRALSVDRYGDAIHRARKPRCPHCSRPTLVVDIKKRARYHVTCSVCGLDWWIRRAPRAHTVQEADTIPE